MQPAALLEAFVTIAGTIFVVELTDKDALMLLSLATTRKARTVFAAGAVAFTIDTAILVFVGSALVTYVPVLWIKLAGGGIMLAYGGWTFVRGLGDGGAGEGKLLRDGSGRGLYAFLAMLVSLMILDLAGDATELVTVLFVAQYGNIILAFFAIVSGLVAATAVETTLGNRLGRFLSARNARFLSTAVLLIIGTLIIASSLFAG